jgi:hypothetical protein
LTCCGDGNEAAANAISNRDVRSRVVESSATLRRFESRSERRFSRCGAIKSVSLSLSSVTAVAATRTACWCTASDALECRGGGGGTERRAARDSRHSREKREERELLDEDDECECASSACGARSATTSLRRRRRAQAQAAAVCARQWTCMGARQSAHGTDCDAIRLSGDEQMPHRGEICIVEEKLSCFSWIVVVFWFFVGCWLLFVLLLVDQSWRHKSFFFFSFFFFFSSLDVAFVVVRPRASCFDGPRVACQQRSFGCAVNIRQRAERQEKKKKREKKNNFLSMMKKNNLFLSLLLSRSPTHGAPGFTSEFLHVAPQV